MPLTPSVQFISVLVPFWISCQGFDQAKVPQQPELCYKTLPSHGQALNLVPSCLLVQFVLDLSYVFPTPLPPASAGEMLVASFISQGTELQELADSIIPQVNLKSTLPQSPTDHPCRGRHTDSEFLDCTILSLTFMVR